MNESRAFCPRCGGPAANGIEAVSGRARGPLCRSCYFDDFELVSVPETVTVTVCPTCGDVDFGDGWVEVSESDLTAVAIDAVQNALRIHRDAEDAAWRVEPEHLDAHTIAMHCLISATVRGELIETTVTVPVTIARQTCDRCSRIAGEYYASIVQIRATDRSVTADERTGSRTIAADVVESMMESGDRNAFVTDIDEVDDGLNIRVSTTKIGHKIARRMVERYGGRFESSETLVTTDADGNDVYRVTYSVRLPAYVAGDIVDPEDDGGPVLVRGATERIRGIRLTSGDPFEAPIDASAGTRLGSIQDATETTVVTVEDEHAVQVIDPETFEAVTIPRPTFFDPDAEQVPVIKTRVGLYMLPDDVEL